MSAARSVEVKFENLTDFTLRRVGFDLPHGVWTSFPPENIGPGDVMSWQTESDGFMTGTEGKVEYRSDSESEKLFVKWDNPFIGSNSYQEGAPNGYRVDRAGGAGDNASVTFTLRPSLVPLGTVSSGFLVENSPGAFASIFRAVLVTADGMLTEFNRNNNNPPPPSWPRIMSFGAGAAIQAVTLIRSNLFRGKLEVIARAANGGLLYFHRPPSLPWVGPFPLRVNNVAVANAAGVPGLIQGNVGQVGNLELVTPLVGGGLLHLARNNDVFAEDPNKKPWSEVERFGNFRVPFAAVALIQSSLGATGVPGDLAMVARAADRLYYFVRPIGQSWDGPHEIRVRNGELPVTGVAGNPTLIQSRFPSSGDFEVVAPLAAGGFLTLVRDNQRSNRDDPTLPWQEGDRFATTLFADQTAVVQRRSLSPGLEVVAHITTSGQWSYFSRAAGPGTPWSGPQLVTQFV
jgi:hypothetical protein